MNDICNKYSGFPPKAQIAAHMIEKRCDQDRYDIFIGEILIQNRNQYEWLRIGQILLDCISNQTNLYGGMYCNVTFSSETANRLVNLMLEIDEDRYFSYDDCWFERINGTPIRGIKWLMYYNDMRRFSYSSIVEGVYHPEDDLSEILITCTDHSKLSSAIAKKNIMDINIDDLLVHTMGWINPIDGYIGFRIGAIMDNNFKKILEDLRAEPA